MHRYQRMHWGRCSSVSRRLWMHSGDRCDRVPGITGKEAVIIMYVLWDWYYSFMDTENPLHEGWEICLHGIWMCLWLTWFNSTSTCGKNKSPKEKSAPLVRTPAGRWDFSYSSAHTSPSSLSLSLSLSLSQTTQSVSVRRALGTSLTSRICSQWERHIERIQAGQTRNELSNDLPHPSTFSNTPQPRPMNKDCNIFPILENLAIILSVSAHLCPFDILVFNLHWLV